MNNGYHENAEVTFSIFYFCLQEESFKTLYLTDFIQAVGQWLMSDFH